MTFLVYNDVVRLSTSFSVSQTFSSWQPLAVEKEKEPSNSDGP